jgi:hypothetical protein
MPKDADIVKRIIKRYGTVIDLKKSPETIMEILRTFAMDLDGGSPPGGTPPSPPSPSPPPGPSSVQTRVTNEEIMRQLLSISRAISKIGK